MDPFFCCCNYATVGHIGVKMINFVVLSMIIASTNILTPRISKIYLLIVSLNVRKLELR